MQGIAKKDIESNTSSDKFYREQDSDDRACSFSVTYFG
jgi:hypothetical protein